MSVSPSSRGAAPPRAWFSLSRRESLRGPARVAAYAAPPRPQRQESCVSAEQQLHDPNLHCLEAFLARYLRASEKRSPQRSRRLRDDILACLFDRRDVALALLRRRCGAERRPLLHQPTPLLEHVPASIGLLNLAADDVRQGCLD